MIGLQTSAVNSVINRQLRTWHHDLLADEPAVLNDVAVTPGPSDRDSGRPQLETDIVATEGDSLTAQTPVAVCLTQNRAVKRSTGLVRDSA